MIEKYFAGDKAYKPAAEGVLKLVAQVRDQGAYVGDFRPANLIWSGKAWIILDSGSIQQGMTIEEAQQKWFQDRLQQFQNPKERCSLSPVTKNLACPKTAVSF